jgi:hypothetical protein
MIHFERQRKKKTKKRPIQSVMRCIPGFLARSLLSVIGMFLEKGPAGNTNSTCLKPNYSGLHLGILVFLMVLFSPP